MKKVAVFILLALLTMAFGVPDSCFGQVVLPMFFGQPVVGTSIAFDVGSQGDQGSGATLTVSHTVANDATWLEVGVTTWLSGGAQTVTVTYNGTSMTGRTAQGTTDKLQSFYLAGPATGTHDIVVTPSSSGVEVAMAAISLKAPTGTSNPSNETANSSDWTNTVTCATGNWSVVFLRYYNQTPTLTNGTVRVTNSNGATQSSINAYTMGSTGSSVTINGSGMAGSTWHTNGASVNK